MIRFLGKLSAALDSLFRLALFATLVAMIAVITAQVIFRIFFTALSWSEELSRYLLVWSSFIGGAVAYKKGAHIAVSFVIDSLPVPARKIVQTISCLLVALFLAVTIWYAGQVYAMQVFQVSPAMGLKMRYVYLIIPISFAVMGVHLLYQLALIWSSTDPREN
ncbi:MAG: TRAP transporter small permease [Desulfopila sp.]